jgi:hypothetical protein
MQADLNRTIQMDDPSRVTLDALTLAADTLVEGHEQELAEIAERLLRAGPIAVDPPPSPGV